MRGPGQAVGAVELVEGASRIGFSVSRKAHHMAMGVWPGLARASLTIGPCGERRRVMLTSSPPLTPDGLLAALQVDPAAVDRHLVGIVRIDLLGDQVEIVVLEHGQAPGELPVVAEQRRRG